MKDLWTEKYRLKKISDYVFRDDNCVRLSFVKSDAIPFAFSGALALVKQH